MLEAAIAVAVLGGLLLFALPGIELQFVLGTVLTVVGLTGGGGAGLLYHVRLRQALLRLGASTRGWLLAPVARHALLDEPAKRRVLPWFRIGAAGFFVCLAGIGMIVVAVLRAALSG
jgi:hypothetical protein